MPAALPPPEVADREERSRGPGGALVALMVAVARVATAAWAFALVVLAGWLISRIF